MVVYEQTELARGELPPGWHVCPNCDGDGTFPGWGNPPVRQCDCCHGAGIVAEERYQQWGAAYRGLVQFVSGYES